MSQVELGARENEEEGEDDMNHAEATEQMIAEKYLLNELSPDARDAFEEHFFDCPDCALDLRAGAAFVREAKTQLPTMKTGSAAAMQPKPKTSPWASLWSFAARPAFAAPVFAALLLVLVYQNAVTFPGLRTAADQPRLVPVAPLRAAVRGASHLTLSADRRNGVVLPIELPTGLALAPGEASPASYSFDLRDPQGKLVWTGAVPAPAQGTGDGQPFSLVVPGAMLRNGSYSLTVTSVGPQGQRSPVEEYFFDIVLTD